MRKSAVFALVLLLVLIVGTAVFFWWQDSSSFGSPVANIPVLRSLLPETSSLIGDWPSTTPYSMQQVGLGDEPGVLVTMQGKFVEPLFYENEMLRGRFVIDGDTNQTPMLVFFTGQGGPFLTGIPSPDGKQISWSFIFTDELVSRVQPQQPVELRFTLSESHEPARAMKARLDELVRDKSVEPEEYVLTPDMISLGVPRGS